MDYLACSGKFLHPWHVVSPAGKVLHVAVTETFFSSAFHSCGGAFAFATLFNDM